MVLIDLPADHPCHRATLAAIDHAADRLSLPADAQVLRTDVIGPSAADLVRDADAVVIGPGSPYLYPATAIDCIRVAREHGIPLVGT